MLLEAIAPRMAAPLALRSSDGLPGYVRTQTVGAGEIVEQPRQSVAGRLLSWQVRTPHHPPATFNAFVYHGWRRNTVFRRSVEIIARSASRAPIDVVDPIDHQSLTRRTAGGGADPDALRFVSLIRRGGRVRPVPGLSGKVLLYQMWQDLFVFGNALFEKVRSRSGRCVELWRLDPRYVAVEPDPYRGVKRYLYNAHGTWWPIELRDVVHLMHTDPDQPWFGVPPIHTALRDVSVDNELVDFFKLTLENFAVPPAVLESDGGPEGIELDDEAAEEARKTWRERYGRKRRGDIAVLPPGVKVKVIGLDFKKLAVGDLVATSESRIAMAHGIPMILLGRSGTQADPTRANYHEAKEHLWTDTIAPLHEVAAELLSIGLLGEFVPEDRGEVAFDVSRIAVLQAARLKRALDAAKVFESGMISRRVGQRMGGLEEHGPDVFYRRNVDAVVDADAEVETIEELDGATGAAPDDEEEEPDFGADDGDEAEEEEEAP